MSLGIVIGFFVLAAIGMPIAFALGVVALGAVAASGIEYNMLPQRMMHAVNSFPLISIPFFMLAGEIMIKAQMMERLIDLANAVVGRVRGGLAHVTMLSAAGLSTVSGSAVSDASALASILVPPMRKAYEPGFAAAVVAAAGNLGPIIPPSGAMIVYAFMAGPSVSVAGLFMAGVVPGLIMTFGMMGMCSYFAHKRNYPYTGDAFRFRRVWYELRRSWIIFLMPVVVIGGIVGGVFTATEGAAIAVVYALAIGFFITRTLTLKDLPGALVRAAITSAMVGAMIAFASAVSYLVTIDLLPQKLATLVQSITSSPILFLLLVAGVLIVADMFLESNAAYIMLVPLLHPIALQYGIDPLHFAFLFVFNLVIGMLTPPVGVVLFVVVGITGIHMNEVIKHIWPFIIFMYGLLLLCMFVPSIVTWFPRMLGY